MDKDMDKGEDRNNAEGGVSRRDFTALSVAAGLAASAGSAHAALAVTESDVAIKTPDGVCDAAYIRPSTGKYPGVLVWTDIFGLRPSFRDLGKRLAGEGYAVLIPNPFYRTAKSPVVVDASTFDFNDPANRQKTGSWTAPINQPGAIERDAAAHIAFLDAQKEVNTAKKIGTQGYCMGGPIAFRTAAAVSDRVGAVASFHGGGLVTDKPNSPHLQAAKTKAQFLIAIAANDDMRSPDEKNVLKDTFAKANLPAEIEVYTGAAHGWCPPDTQVYNEPQAEKAWTRLLALYGKALA